MAEDRNDRVGYGRPPKSGQFKPGKSGNPRGRPKGSTSFPTALEAELDSPIVVTENGRRKTIRKRDVLAKQLVHKSLAGDPRAIQLLLAEMRQIASVGPADKAPIDAAPEDKVVMEDIIRRVRATVAETPTSLMPGPVRDGQSLALAATIADDIP